MEDQRVLGIIEGLQEIANDVAVPRNVKEKLTLIIGTLKNTEEEFLMRKDKALSELDEIVEDTNISHTQEHRYGMLSVHWKCYECSILQNELFNHTYFFYGLL